MNIQQLKFCGIPSVVYGESSDMVYLYVHGKCGKKEEAQSLAEIICPQGFQVLAVDLPEHGERKNQSEKLLPWVVVPELNQVLSYAKQNWENVSLHATSIGAYFSLLAFPDETFQQALFVSPIVNMEKLIKNMMQWANVSKEQLKAEKEIPTDFGETLSWEYYAYVKNHPVAKWNSKTSILYAGKDNMTDLLTMTIFSKRFGCSLQIYNEGEHYFHTPKQLEVWRDFVQNNYTSANEQII